METTQHTPTPKLASILTDIEDGLSCMAPDIERDIQILMEPLIAYALRACNSHEALLAAIKAFLSDQTISDALESMLNREWNGKEY
jgi:hypothetical protein